MIPKSANELMPFNVINSLPDLKNITDEIIKNIIC